MKIAEYFASLSIRVSKQDQKKVDTFLGNIEKGLKGNVKGTNDLEKAVKKETKTTVDGAKSKVSAQKAVNKETAAAVVVTNKLTQAVTKQQTVVRRNAESINKLFPAMGRSPLPARSRDRADAVSIYKDMFKAADVRIKDLNRLANKVREEGNLLGRIGKNSPHFANLPNMGKMREVTALGRIGKNAQAFGSYGKVRSYQSVKAQRISGEVSALGRIGRNASTYGAPSRGSLQERLAAFRSNRVEGIQVQNQVEASERRILDLKRREDSRRLTHQQTVERMALRHEQKLAEIREKNAVKLSRASRSGASRSEASRSEASRSEASYGRANYLHAGGAAGALARYGVASLPFVGGVYGLSRANTISQELQANELALRAVAGEKAGGYQEYLSSLGNRLGMTTRDLQPGFTQYLASAQGTALEPTIQRDFSNFTQYGAVMGLNPEQMKGSLKAITQMVSKQQIYAEELKGQLAERMPAAVRLMADAMTGGDTKALIKMMENGELDPNTALPKFFEEMRKRSEHMLPEYFKSTRFAQGSMNKAAEDQFKRFAKGGGDAGFARLFNSLATVIKEAGPAVDALAKGFNEISKYTSFAMLLPQSFKRAFEGRDSWVADALGEMNAKIVYDLGAGLGELASEIMKTLGTAIDGWGLLLGVVGPAITDFLRRIKDIFLYTFKILNSFLPGGGGMDSAANASRALTASLNGASPEEVKAIAEGMDVKVESQAPPSPWATPISSTGGFLKDVAVLGTTQIAEKTGIAAWWDSFTGLMKDRKPYDGDRASMDYQREMAMSREKFKASQNNQVNIQPGAFVISTQATNAEEVGKFTVQYFQTELQKTLMQNPNTGG